MPKKILFFSKSQRIAIVTLLVLLIVLIIVADCTMTHWAKQPESFYNESFTNEIKIFEEKINALAAQHSFDEIDEHHIITQQSEIVEPVYFNFDPNTIDSIGLTELGLKPWTAKNIIKYRNKGGRFKDKNDFAKIYGISPEQFNALEPFIQIEEPSVDSIVTSENIAHPDIIIELNTADTAQLRLITNKGLANGIINYRNKLGGYCSIEQLNEVYNMTDDKLLKLKSHLTIDTSQIKRINVNQASVERLKKHPYINFYQAKAIFEFRRAKKRINSANELLFLDELSPADIEKITPYLSFE